MTVETSSLLVLNRKSRSGTETLDDIIARLEKQGPVTILDAKDPESLERELVARAEAVDRIVLGGGDGTINLALAGLQQAKKPFGVLPMGTANDFARSLMIPPDLHKAVEIICAGQTRSIDIGVANDIYFVNAIGIGLGPSMSRQLHAQSKKSFGVFAYLFGMFAALRGTSHFTAQIEAGDRKHEGEFMQITVANGIHYGGGMTVADNAKIDDGLLDVLLLPRATRTTLLLNALRLREGDMRASADLTHFRCEKVMIITEQHREVTADGEFLSCTPVECRVRPGALTVFAPSLEAVEYFPFQEYLPCT